MIKLDDKKFLKEIPTEFCKWANDFLVGCFLYVKENNDLNDLQRDQITTSMAKIYKFRKSHGELSSICKEYFKYFNYFNKREFNNVNDVYSDFVRYTHFNKS